MSVPMPVDPGKYRGGQEQEQRQRLWSLVIPEAEYVSAMSQTITVRKMLYGLLNCLSVPEHNSEAKGNRIEKSPQPQAGPPTALTR
jgi:hypothetical protein